MVELLRLFESKVSATNSRSAAIGVIKGVSVGNLIVYVRLNY
jgi:hypothetical protein